MKSPKHSSPYSNRLALFRRPTKVARAMALAAMVTAASLPFFSSSVTAANTEIDYIGSASGNLSTASNYTQNTAPSVTTDLTFPAAAATGIREFGTGTTGTSLTTGSLDDLSTATIGIRNDTSTSTAVTLTLGGSGNLGNSVSGNSSTTQPDLIYGGVNSILNITGAGGPGTGTLTLALGQTGNFNVATGGIVTITAPITGTGFSIVKTGAGLLTLNTTTASTFGGAGSSFTLADGSLSVTSTVSSPFGSSSNLINLGSLTVAPTVPLTITGSVTLTAYAGVNINRDITFVGATSPNFGAASVKLAGTDSTVRTINNTATSGPNFNGGFSVASGSTVTTLAINATGSSVAINGVISNGFATNLNFVKTGTAGQTFGVAETYTGSTSVTGSTLTLNSVGSITGSTAVTLNSGGLLLDNSATQVANRVNDTAPIALNNSALTFNGSTTTVGSVAATETLGAVTLGTSTIAGGNPLISIVSPSTAIALGDSETLTLTSLAHMAGGEIPLVNGTGLGGSSSALEKILVTNAPTLSGTTASTGSINSTVKNTQIVPFLTGEATSTTGGTGTITGTANTFVTYDPNNGLRPLNPTDEFTQNATTAGANVYLNLLGTTQSTTATMSSINSLVLAGATQSAATTLSIPTGVTLTNASGAILFTPGSTGTYATISGAGTLAFGANEALITVDTGQSSTIAASITGTGGLTKTGLGTLALNGANGSLSGQVTLNGGTTSVSQFNGLGTGNVVDNATLTLAPPSTTATFANNISGPGALVVQNSGVDSLTGTGTVTGTVTINVARLNLGAHEVITGPVVVSPNAATLDLGTQSTTISNLSFTTGTTAGTATILDGSLTLGANTLTLSPSNTSGTTTLDLSGLTAFTYTQAAAGQSFSVNTGLGATANNATLNTTVNLANGSGGNNITVTTLNVGPGAGANTSGIGTLTLGATANNIDTTTIEIGGYRSTGGTIQFATTATPATSTLTLRGVGGGVTPVTTLNIGNTLAGGNSNTGIFDTSLGTINAIVNNVYVFNEGQASAATSGNAATLSMGAGSFNIGTLTLGNAIAASTTTAIAATVNQNAGAVLADSVLFNVAPAANTAVTFTSKYVLGTSTTTGILSAGTIGFGAFATNAGSTGTLNFNNGTITNYDNTLSAFNGQGNANGSTTTNVQNLTISGLSSSTLLNIVLASTGTQNFLAESGQSITETSTALISGFGAVTANGTGTLNLNGANAYVGGTNVTAAGTVNATTNTALGASNSSAGLNMTPASGTATVNFTSTAPAIASLASSGAGTSNVVLGNATTPAATTLTIGNTSNLSSTFAGSISDRSGTAAAAIGNVTKAGTGTLTLSGANTYTGTTLVSAGTLLVNGSTATAGTLSVSSAATLGGTGSVGVTTVNSGGVITGATVGTMGTLTLASLAITSGTYQVDINSNSTTGGDLLNIAGALSGSNSTININSGTLNGTSTYIIADYASDATGTVFTTLTGASGYSIVETSTMLELVPVPEPSTYIGGLVLVAALGWSVRGRFARRSA